MVLHVGDFAYDFDSSGGSVGRAFSRRAVTNETYKPRLTGLRMQPAGPGYAQVFFWENWPPSLRMPKGPGLGRGGSTALIHISLDWTP